MLLIEQCDESLVGRRYLSQESIAAHHTAAPNGADSERREPLTIAG